MVNKALLALAGLVVISLFGVGVFVGLQVAGGDGIAEPADSTPTAGTPADAPTAAPTATGTATPEPTPEPTPTATPTATPEPTPTPIGASEFDEPNISEYLAQYLNENRSEQGLDTLTTDGRTAETVNAMAQNHSETMAEEQELAHTIDGVRSEDRYEYYDLTSVCSFATTETPSGNELEAIAMTVAGQSYTEDGQQRFNENESQVARALLDEMLANDDYRERLTHPDAGRVGVGVAVTDSGEVYATVNTCA